MDREAERNRLKNEKRRQARSRTTYAETGKEMRQATGGAFGSLPAPVYNKCAEGTTAIRSAENDLSDQEKKVTHVEPAS